MRTLKVEFNKGVAFINLSRGVTNAINLDLIDELGQVLHSVKDNTDVCGLVLGSENDKFFSIGFDIPELFGLEMDNFAVFYRRFNQLCLKLFEFPKPVIAALSGHAIAGGCILALCCDYRYIADGRKLMGLNEIKIGVPVPYLADCILRELVGVRAARDIMESGDFYQAEDLLQMGVVDRLFYLEEIRRRSIEKVLTLGASPITAYASIKRNRTEGIARHIRVHLDKKAKIFIEYWYSEESRKLIKEAMAKF